MIISSGTWPVRTLPKLYKLSKLSFLDVEKRYEIEVNTFQQRVNRIQSELDKATNDMKKHLAEYKNLMNVKQSLEKVTFQLIRFKPIEIQMSKL